MPDQLMPLATHWRLHTHDADEARVRIGEAIGAHELRPVGAGARLDVRLHGVRFDYFGLYVLGYGAEVSITPSIAEDSLFVEIPSVGAAEVRHGRESIRSSPELAAVMSTHPRSMRWLAGNRQYIVHFDRGALEAHLGRLLGRRPDRPLTFSLGMDLTRPPARSWRSVVELLRVEAEAGGGMLEQPLVVRQLEGLLMTQLLMAQPSNYSEALRGNQPRVAPPTVQRAVRLIEEHAAEPLTVEDIAEAVGVSVRALQEGFRRHVEKTPMGFLREVRLERARAELAVTDPVAATVTDVAFRWGFAHLGRFSLTYRQRFGESPSETLRR
ncbi:AraC family transcriptional regulator [Microbispora cellulosiformans]|uniref:AraC family transcriptional regulator n=1 Tax=Microbispora cellulosiformans TaxID=2614688 RepID=A0A5J5K5N9_9ACTN|nr:AraC family transcriptional regulator [Microbispora cellulosiformans]KAA9378796.1 AraC family transcriptional regulator [Microbispora cellulosiformans]